MIQLMPISKVEKRLLQTNEQKELKKQQILNKSEN